MPQDVYTAEVAERYDGWTAAESAAEVIGPTVDFLAGLAAGGAALEFAIGTGRVAIPLADRGVPVNGIEMSEAMIARLRAKDGDRIPVVRGDMATMTVPGRFRLVYLVFNTLSNLLDQDEQVACFANAARHLEPGGAFVIELGLPQLRRLPPGQIAVPFEVSDDHLGFDTYELVAQRLTSHHYRPGEAAVAASVHRYAWPAELDLMARLAGMTLDERVADWHRHPFTDDSESHLSVWRTPLS